MADQYQNFSNPTIIPSQPTGWMAASEGVGNATKTIGDYLATRQAETRGLQLGQAAEFGKAQADVWAKMQDPLARAAAYANLAMRGYPMSVIDQKMKELDSQYGPQSLGTMLQGNPYARYVLPTGGGQSINPVMGNDAVIPSINSPTQASSNAQPSPVGDQSSPAMTLNPLSSGNPVMGNLVQPEHKLTAFGTEPEKSVTDLGAKSQVTGSDAYANKVAGTQGQEDTAYSALNSLSDNLVGNVKAAMIQSGGGGAMPKLIGQIAAGPFGQITGMSKNTGAIPAMEAVKRDSAIAYARNLAGGAQGVQKMMDRVLDTMPDQGLTVEQATGTVAEMKMTALALKTGLDKLKLQAQQNGISPENFQKQLNSMSADDFQKIADQEKNMMDPQMVNGTLKQIIGQLASVPARLQGNMFTGETYAPETNPLSKKLGMNFNPGSQFTAPSQAKQLDANTAKQILQSVGGDKDKARQLAKQQGYSF